MRHVVQKFLIYGAVLLCGQIGLTRGAELASATLVPVAPAVPVATAIAAAQVAPATEIEEEAAAEITPAQPVPTAHAEEVEKPAPVSSVLSNQSATQMLCDLEPAIKPITAMQPVVQPSYDGCSPGDCAADYCAPPSDNVSLIAGGQATFFWPNFHQTASNVIAADSNSGSFGSFSSNSPGLNNNFIAAPRVWLGIQGCRWGLVSRYWGASLWNDTFNPSLPTGQIGNYQSNRFNAYLVDFEVQRIVYRRIWTHRFSFGLRYGGINLDSDVNAFSVNQFGTASATAFQGNQFYGTGITWGMFSTRPILCTCWSLYAGPRVSYLWGQSQGVAQAGAIVSDSLGNASAMHGGINRGPSGLFIAEVQFGAQWERQLVCSPAKAFIRIGGEFQYWDTSSNRSVVAGSLAAVPTVGAGSFAQANGGFLFNMVGLTIGTGIIY